MAQTLKELLRSYLQAMLALNTHPRTQDNEGVGGYIEGNAQAIKELLRSYL